jgi:multiple sugar transport system ATP-binding protein
VKVTIEVVEPLGSETLLYASTGKHQIVCKVDARNKAEVNQDTEMVFDMSKIHLFDAETQQALF